jgi:hypothetical protein
VRARDERRQEKVRNREQLRARDARRQGKLWNREQLRARDERRQEKLRNRETAEKESQEQRTGKTAKDKQLLEGKRRIDKEPETAHF